MSATTGAPDEIAPALLRWYDSHGRKDLPWKAGRDPYRIWLSEIMLQQTQVTTVLPYFERFVTRFPDVTALAQAPLDDVLALWSGLGYYARARNLHRSAGLIVTEHGGEFPRDVDTLTTLPGIGRSTAGAIAAMAFDVRAPILDGNVKRVLARLTAQERWTGEREVEKQLWALAETLTPAERVADYTQAAMDLGATLCTRSRPACVRCPLEDRCAARATGREQSLPVPRPKRAKPQRRTRLLMLEDADGAVLLERRPAQGIWGGLWCFPQLDDADVDACAHLAERLALPEDAIEPIETWADLRHVFTHFVLDIEPLRLRARLRPHNVRETDLDWIAPSTAADLALAAPVARLLRALDGDDLFNLATAAHTTEKGTPP